MSSLNISSLQDVQNFVNQAYQTEFGPLRHAVFDPTIEGDADYWVEKIMAGEAGHAPEDLAGHLAASHEATNVDAAGNPILNDPGGVDPTRTITSQWDEVPWLGGSFGDVGSGSKYESANKYGHATNQIQGISNAIGAALTAANTAAGVADTNEGDNATNPYLNRIYNTVADSELGGNNNNGNNNNNNGNNNNGNTNTNNYLTSDDLTAWWDALDKSSFTGSQTGGTQTGGMDDFMRFMMFMSMMRPQGGMGGGSQYGYGGLNPGGVMSAYNPMENIQSAISAFQTIPGIGTSLTNAT